MIVCDSRRPWTPTKSAGSGSRAGKAGSRGKRHERGVDRHDSLAASLRLADVQEAPSEVDVVPVEAKQLAPAQAGIGEEASISRSRSRLPASGAPRRRRARPQRRRCGGRRIGPRPSGSGVVRRIGHRLLVVLVEPVAPEPAPRDAEAARVLRLGRPGCDLGPRIRVATQRRHRLERRLQVGVSRHDHAGVVRAADGHRQRVQTGSSRRNRLLKRRGGLQRGPARERRAAAGRRPRVREQPRCQAVRMGTRCRGSGRGEGRSGRSCRTRAFWRAPQSRIADGSTK
jgi:hypothetical protein